MYLSWIDYVVLIVLLIFSAGFGLYQGFVRSKQSSTKEYLVADGKMNIIPTAMSLWASVNSASSFLGTPVEMYFFGSMFFYCIFSSFIATFLTMKFFIPKFHHVGNPSIYAYLEERFSLTIRILVTCCYTVLTILYMAVIVYGPSLALSQVTGLNIWISVAVCGIVCTIYTSFGGMKAVIWADVIQASIMFLGLILSIIFGLLSIGGISKAFEIVKNGNRLQFAIFQFDPSIRYSFWSIFIGHTFSATAQYACIQTQAQRFMCVKNTKSAQRVAWAHYAMNATMLIVFICVGALIYAKYSQCDPLQAKTISRSDQLYPLFVVETLGRIAGFTGLFISCVLSATLSTFSSGVNSMATVILEDIYKKLATKNPMSSERQVLLSKILSVTIGCLTVLLAFLVSYMKSNIITMILQIFGAFTGPMLGVYFLGLFTTRVKSQSALVGFFVSFMFQMFLLVGSMFTVRPLSKQGGRLPLSVAGCSSPVNVTLPLTPNQKSTALASLFAISPLWFTFIGASVTIIFGLIFSFVLDSKDTKVIDPSLVVSRKEIFSCGSSANEKSNKPGVTEKDDGTLPREDPLEHESML